MSAGWPRFQAAAADALAQLGPAQLRELCHRLDAEWASEALPRGLGGEHPEVVRALISARVADALSGPLAAAYLTGLLDGYKQQQARYEIELVWSGPTTHAVPVRDTERVLIELIEAAREQLILMTYSARPYAPVRDAIVAAAGRGVSVLVVVETLQGAGSAISGAEPASAFAGIAGLELWHWPAAARPEAGAKQHAKLAIADRRMLLVTSANLTASGASRNIEAGLLVRGGTAPTRAADHIHSLRSTAILTRLI